MLKCIQHRNIIECFGSFVEEDCLYIVLEYAEFGDLHSLLKR